MVVKLTPCMYLEIVSRFHTSPDSKPIFLIEIRCKLTIITVLHLDTISRPCDHHEIVVGVGRM